MVSTDCEFITDRPIKLWLFRQMAVHWSFGRWQLKVSYDFVASWKTKMNTSEVYYLKLFRHHMLVVCRYILDRESLQHLQTASGQCMLISFKISWTSCQKNRCCLWQHIWTAVVYHQWVMTENCALHKGPRFSCYVESVEQHSVKLTFLYHYVYNVESDRWLASIVSSSHSSATMSYL